MNALFQAQQAYGSTQTATRTGRETEAQLLKGIIAELSRFNGDQPDQFPKLAAAIHRNRRIWTHLATSVADPDNKYPDALKARLFYLSEFVEQHSRKVLKKDASVSVLIEINTAVVRGLLAGGKP